ncbi:hypothetical protein [Sphaerimonospora thailandensis]|uniref:Uncharacterized protein n=1 Tax=Sphaerimonospora thailandensis TaxID=795644 RepID=A0A8J3R505_9ACTN|nr:hypothetical protein [Sphaerimonospora thailandensis]GIH67845.1 hypothetical protein Mth01_00980 [Sphaerimonospora thailandensis]
MTNNAPETYPEILRGRMVDRILVSHSLSSTVEAALRHVERHRYVRSPAIVQGDSLAYFTFWRSEETAGRWQLGAIGHGPLGHHLATRIAEQIGVWNRGRTADPELLAYPTGLPMPSGMTGRVITESGIRLIVHY